jgi:hypothetical protein
LFVEFREENQQKREKEIEDKKKCFQMGTHHQIIEGKRERILRMAISHSPRRRRYWRDFECDERNLTEGTCKLTFASRPSGSK